MLIDRKAHICEVDVEQIVAIARGYGDKEMVFEPIALFISYSYYLKTKIVNGLLLEYVVMKKHSFHIISNQLLVKKIFPNQKRLLT